MMLDKDEERGEGGEVEQHQRQHDQQHQVGAGLLLPVIMVPLLPDPEHVNLSDKLVIIY